MENVFKMSLFMPPISPIKDKTTGRTVKSATLTPLRTINLEEIYKLITSNEKLTALTLEVRNAALQGDEDTSRLLKQQTLPYVTPCGIFTRRRSDCLEELSGLVVVDIDHLESTEEAETGIHQSQWTGRESLHSSCLGTKRHRWNPLGHELCTLHVRQQPPPTRKRSGYIGKRPRTLLLPLP